MRPSSQLKIQQTLKLTNHEEFNACFQAIDTNDAAALQQLLDHGAKIKKANRHGQRAVLVAAELGHWNCVEVILDKL